MAADSRGGDLFFPNVEDALEDGLLAYGGDLSVDRLLLAYRSGIFPWYSDGDPILWFSPDPRAVILPETFRVPRRLRRSIAKSPFTITWNKEFRSVIEHCRSSPRPGEGGTWITAAMLEAYCLLHEKGHAHSVEVWDNGRLVGGLYGIMTGRCFSGESMFSLVNDASKAGFVSFAGKLWDEGCTMIDCQMETPHLARFGMQSIPRREFIRLLGESSLPI